MNFYSLKKYFKIITIAFFVFVILAGISSIDSFDKNYNQSTKNPINSDTNISTGESTTAAPVQTTSEEVVPIENTTENATAAPSSANNEATIQQGTLADLSSIISSIPSYNGSPYATVNNNIPFFTESENTLDAFEHYSELDSLGRCGVAYANICKELMPTEERGKIGSIKPTGWHSVRYENVDGNYLYNRCHLIGYQLAGENANEKNLITGTRYLNTEGMLPFENMVAEYVERTSNHVLYRVTPIFEGNNLLATGVLMEAKSVEDNGSSICFNVFCYNSQPGIKIDYATGDNELTTGETSAITTSAAVNTPEATTSETTTPTVAPNSANVYTYIVNTNTGKFHRPDCSSVSDMKDKNKWEYTGTRENLTDQGYEPCKRCNP